MKRTASKLSLFVFVLFCAAAAHASPNPLVGLPLPSVSHFNLRAQAPVTCPAGANHCTILTWTVSTDAAANPTLGYNIFRWLTSSTAPVSVGGTVTGGAPLNASLVGVGCSASSCTFTDTTVTPGNFSYSVTASLNGAQSTLSNIVSVTILPATPVLSGTGN